MDQFIRKIKFGIGLIILFSGLNSTVIAQTYNPKIADLIKQVENPQSFLKKYEELGVKDTYHKGLDSTFYWLKSIIDSLGYKTLETNFLYNDGIKSHTLRNLIFDKKGDKDSCIIVCGHYDSKVGPGVNDNGSGDFAILQMAKLIKNVSTKYSIKFIFFTGEEIDYLGSKDFVKRINKDSIKIKYVINLDQLGGSVDQDNSSIKCEQDESSANRFKSSEITLLMANVYKLYTTLKPIISPAYASDYLAFRDAGYIITGIYQASTFAQYHTEYDLLKFMELNSLTEVTRGAIAYLLHISEARDILNLDQKHYNNPQVNVYYTNGSVIIKSNQKLSFQLFDSKGAELLAGIHDGYTSIWPQSKIKAGIYFIHFQSEHTFFYNKFFIEP